MAASLVEASSVTLSILLQEAQSGEYGCSEGLLLGNVSLRTNHRRKRLRDRQRQRQTECVYMCVCVCVWEEDKGVCVMIEDVGRPTGRDRETARGDTKRENRRDQDAKTEGHGD